MPKKPDMHRASAAPFLRGLLASLSSSVLLAAQAQPVSFRTGDGSRFHLIATGGPLVHWAMATPAGAQEDPPGLEGLSLACARAAMYGTWHTGSRDAAAERTALDQADQGSDAATATARALADPRAWLRVLTGAPAMDLALEDRTACAVLSLTTVSSAIPRIAQLLVERREDAALRSLHEEWRAVADALRQRTEADPLWPLRSEAVGLCYPGHPLGRAVERPAANARPDRATAMQVWRRTQRPDRCVHVLVGGFDLAATRAELERSFAVTALREPVPSLPAPRALPAVRRSSVPGSGNGAVLAYRLHGSEPEQDLAVAVHWLGTGPDCWLARLLPASGGRVSSASVTLLRPGVGAPGLLLVELSGKASSGDLAELGLATCAVARTAEPVASEVAAATSLALAAWERATRSPRQFAAVLAERALQRPADPVLTAPAPATPAGVAAALKSVFGSNQPAIVEWQPL